MSVTCGRFLKTKIKMLNEKREHVHKLPGVIVPENVTFTSDLEKAVCDAEVVVWCTFPNCQADCKGYIEIYKG